MEVLGIGWAGVITEQYDAMQPFLQECMGLRLEHEMADIQIAHYRLPSGQLLEVYGSSIRQRRPSKAEYFNGHCLSFEVDDIQQARALMLEHGIHFLEDIKQWEDELWCGFVGPEDWRLQIQNVGRRPAENALGLHAFSWAGLVVEDFDPALRFFTDVMHMPAPSHSADDLSAQFRLSGGHVFEVLHPDHPWHAHLTHITIGFEVDDIVQTRTRMQASGIDFITPIEITAAGHTFTFFRDLDDYRYALWKPA